jgi:hypothetical protein
MAVTMNSVDFGAGWGDNLTIISFTFLHVKIIFTLEALSLNDLIINRFKFVIIIIIIIIINF